MNFHESLNAWRTCLLDPPPNAVEREAIANSAAQVKVISGVAGCIFASTGILGLGLVNQYPFNGMCLFVTSGLLGLVCLESYFISRIVEGVMRGKFAVSRCKFD